MRQITLYLMLAFSIQPPFILIGQDTISLSRYPIYRNLEFLNNGQSANLMQARFQDSRGFIWGADNNFSPMRFDGNRVESFKYKTDNPTTPSDGAMWPKDSKYFEDSAGRIWFIYSNNDNLDCYHPASERFERFRQRLDEAAGEDIGGRVRDVCEDSNHSLWIGSDKGVFKYLPQSDTLIFFKKPGNVTLCFEDEEKNIWLNVFRGYRKHALCKIDPETGSILEWIDYPVPLEIFPNEIHFSYSWPGDSSRLLVINKQLLLFYPNQKKVHYLHQLLLGKEEQVIDFWDAGKTALITTDKGRLLEYFPATQSLSTIRDWSGTVDEKTDLYVQTPFRSNEGITWLMKIEVHKDANIRYENFQFFPPKINLHKTSLPLTVPDMYNGDHIFDFNGEVYAYTKSGVTGIRNKTAVSPEIDLTLPGVPNPDEVNWRFTTDKSGTLWTVAAGNGKSYIRSYDKTGKQVFSNVSDNKGEAAIGYYVGLAVDKKGKLWIGGPERLVCFDPVNRSFQSHKISTRGAGTTNIIVDRDNNIWCGTGPILSHFNQQTRELKNYGVNTTELTGYIRVLYQDKQGEIWVGTNSGLFRLIKDTGDFKHYSEEEGIDLSLLYSIFEDVHEQLWVSGMNLYLYDRQNDVFLPYGIREGVEFYSMNRGNSYRKDKDGYIYFQSIHKEVFYFKPEKMNPEPALPEVHFMDLFLFNKRVNPSDSTGILAQALDYSENIELAFAQNDIAINYTAPEYTHPDKLEFLVKLDGFHHDWQNMGNKREVRFTGLPSGDYTLKVKARNHFHFESQSPRTLKITILPPWYRTWWAYLLWAAIITGSLYWLYRFQLNRRLAEAEAQRLKELDDAKNVLYTNITHEFRTPLTVILGMVDQMKADPKNWFSEGASLIRRNGKLLLNLVNQMLDLSKLESGNMPLHLIQGDVVGYLKYLSESFHSYADSKDIRLHFRSDFPELVMDHDPEKLQNIVSNLLSNAVKFTPAGGDVYLDLRGTGNEQNGKEPTELLLQVSDNGPGIAPEHLPYIFDRFYQADPDSHRDNTRRGEGTGIGLALTRELVQVLGGNIQVESELGAGTHFKIWFPVEREAKTVSENTPSMATAILSETVITEAIQPQALSLPEQNDRDTVLLVEDNPDVLTYLSAILSTRYQVLSASDGQSGIDTAKEVIPDLIVSDVMMPEKDGFELCEALKSDERTSHIPIVLLTAKADQRSKIEGLSHRADAYLTKPFHQEELLVRLEKLIELRKSLQRHYQQQGALRGVLTQKAIGQEDAFLKRVVEAIEAEMSDENFGMPQLCKALRMTRSTLFRKLKALTGKSTSNLIRTVRLEKAKELLENTDKTVSEVCYEVGFNNHSYFSTVFKEEFGVAPSEVRK